VTRRCTLAAYNAGPARVAKLHQKAKSVGLDNIYKYYTAYRAIAAQRAAQASASD
jgi:hypothetical protein